MSPPPFDPAGARLLDFQKQFTDLGILLCFNGPLSSSLIQEIGLALRNHMEHASVAAGNATDVFAAYIETTQNIRHYYQRLGWHDAIATVVIAQDAHGHHTVSAGNRVLCADGEQLLVRVSELAALNGAALKAAYREQLRRERSAHSMGAGLGLLDLARRASRPLSAHLRALDNDTSFYSLTVVI